MAVSCAVATATLPSRLIGPISAQSLGAPTFTAAQQSEGDAIYQESCASCHGRNLDDGEFGPQLKGIEFRSAWFGRSADVVFAKIETMPPAAPGSLGAEKHANLLAYLMSQNQLISPLKQINKGNVGTLRAAWSWALPNGPNKSTPLFHDGVLFLHAYGDKVQAIGATTGDLLWAYSRWLPVGTCPTVKRAIALYGDNVYVGTSDTHIVALNAKTGPHGLGQADCRSEAGVRSDGRRPCREGTGVVVFAGAIDRGILGV